MGAGFDAFNSSLFSGSPVSASHTHTPVGSPSLLIGTIYWADNAVSAEAATYGGDAMVEVGVVTGADQRAAIFKKVNPKPGPQTFAVSWTNATNGRIGSISFLRASDAPIADFQGTEEGDGDVTLVIPNTRSLDALVQIAGNNATSAHTPQSGQTELWDAVSPATTRISAGYYKVNPADGSIRITTSATAQINAGCRVVGLGGGPKLLMMQFKELLDDLKRGLLTPDQMKRRLERAWSI